MALTLSHALESFHDMVQYEGTKHLTIDEYDVNVNATFDAKTTEFNIAFGLYPQDWLPVPVDITGYLELRARKVSWVPFPMGSGKPGWTHSF